MERLGERATVKGGGNQKHVNPSSRCHPEPQAKDLAAAFFAAVISLRVAILPRGCRARYTGREFSLHDEIFPEVRPHGTVYRLRIARLSPVRTTAGRVAQPGPDLSYLDWAVSR